MLGNVYVALVVAAFMAMSGLAAYIAYRLYRRPPT